MSKHFVIDENHNLVEAYSAQEVLSVLEQAIADGSLANVVAGQAFVDKLKCCVSGQTNRIAFVTQAKYNELEEKEQTENGVYYYITDDDTLEGINTFMDETLNKGLLDRLYSKPLYLHVCNFYLIPKTTGSLAPDIHCEFINRTEGSIDVMAELSKINSSTYKPISGVIKNGSERIYIIGARAEWNVLICTDGYSDYSFDTSEYMVTTFRSVISL